MRHRNPAARPAATDDLTLHLTVEDLLADLDPGWLRWTDASRAARDLDTRSTDDAAATTVEVA